MSTPPTDFQVRYAWYEGSMPPPYYYEYEIRIGPGTRGRILFRPDYDVENPPTWTREFTVTEDDLNALYDMTVGDRGWRRAAADELFAVGGPQMQLVVIAHDQARGAWSFSEDSPLARVGQYVKSLAPERVWHDLMTRRDEYIRSCNQ